MEFTDAAELTALRERAFRRLLLVSAGAHLVLGVLLVWTPSFRPPVSLPGVVSVDLVAAPGLPAAPAPTPEPAPAPPAPAVKPKPPPPVQREVVLPEKPKPVEQAKPKPKPKAPPKPAPAPEPPADEEYDDVLARLRAESGETAPAPPQAVAQATGGGAGIAVGRETALWLRDARNHVRRAWVLPPGFRDQALEAHIVVELDAGGRVIGEPRITRRSGNPWFDDSVARAVVKASPLPAPPNAGEWPFVFRPDEAF